MVRSLSTRTLAHTHTTTLKRTNTLTHMQAPTNTHARTFSTFSCTYGRHTAWFHPLKGLSWVLEGGSFERGHGRKILGVASNFWCQNRQTEIYWCWRWTNKPTNQPSGDEWGKQLQQLLRCDKDGRELRGEGGGCRMAHWFAYLLPDPAGTGLIPSIPDTFSEEKIGSAAKVKRLINSAAQRKVDSGLKMLIESI